MCCYICDFGVRKELKDLEYSVCIKYCVKLRVNAAGTFDVLKVAFLEHITGRRLIFVSLHPCTMLCKFC